MSRTTTRLPRISRLIPIPFLALIAGLAPDDGPKEAVDQASIVETSDSFESHGKTIEVERFEPRAAGKHPVVLVLHGSGGMEVGGFMFRKMARDLAGRGYVAVIPHYFDRTGTRIADPKLMVERFKDWMETIGDATTYAASLPDADADRVAFVGFSLGGYLSLSNATFDPRIKAVVEYFGGLPDPLADRAGKLPPTLILHGDADPIVPVSEARELEDRLKANGIPYEMTIFAGAGHGFLGKPGRDASRKTLEFLDKHLGR